MSDATVPVLIDGEWRVSRSVGTFQADNPALGTALEPLYPVSSREEALEALTAASAAAEILSKASGESVAAFLEAYARGIEARADELVESAHTETGLPKAPRLKVAELPRTSDQLRQAAKIAREGSWQKPVWDRERNIHSMYAPLGGPVFVLGPNNFPFAFNSIAGGDFAAAIASHNPVIAKANPSHPGTTKLLAEIAHASLLEAGLPTAAIQLIYHVPNDVGLELVAHPLMGATAFTGSRGTGLKLKAAAESAGRPIYLEMSSINPVVFLDGALRERGDALVDELAQSVMLGVGQFCTKPGFVILPDSEAGRRFADLAKQRFEAAAAGVLLGKAGLHGLTESVGLLTSHGAEILSGGKPADGTGFRFQNTLLRVSGDDFLSRPYELQTEAFGPVALLVMSKSVDQTIEILRKLEGNLTGTIYAEAGHDDDADYARVEPELRRRVGRLINNKMPTGVTVSPAMNHGGPFPSTGHPGFTAVGLPASIQRFGALYCYDNVPANRLPDVLREGL